MSADRLRQRNDPCGRVSKNLDPIQRIVYNRCPLWTAALARGVIGNTPGSGPGESRFEPWRANRGCKRGAPWRSPFCLAPEKAGRELPEEWPSG